MRTIVTNQILTDELGLGNKLSVTVSSGGSGSLVRLFNGVTVETVSLASGTTNYFGVYTNPCTFRITCNVGTITVNEYQESSNVEEITTTYANLIANYPAASNTGSRATLSDVNNITVRSDGTRYRNISQTRGTVNIGDSTATAITEADAGVILYDGVINSGTNVLNVPSGSFKNSDVGKSLALCSQSVDGVTGAGRQQSTAGTILQVNSPTQVVLSITVGSTITGAIVVYGVDIGVRLQALLDAVSATGGGIVHIPEGAYVSGQKITIPNNMGLVGVGNAPQAYGAGSFLKLMGYYGTSLFYAGASVLASEPFIQFGTSDFARTAALLQDINIDCLQRTQDCVKTDCWGSNILSCTLIGGTRYTLETGSSQVISNSILAGWGRNNVISASSGDIRIMNNYIWGQQWGRSGIIVFNVDNVQIQGNHFFRANEPASPDPAHAITLYYDSGVNKGGINIAGNSFDHSGAEHVRIILAGTTTLRSVNITGNHGYQNDAHPNNTYSWMKADIATGCNLNGLSVVGNTGRSSWSNPALSTVKHFIDNSASVGNINGSTFVGNTCNDIATSFYSAGFAPDHSSGNIQITTGGVVTVV